MNEIDKADYQFICELLKEERKDLIFKGKTTIVPLMNLAEYLLGFRPNLSELSEMIKHHCDE